MGRVPIHEASRVVSKSRTSTVIDIGPHFFPWKSSRHWIMENISSTNTNEKQIIIIEIK